MSPCANFIYHSSFFYFCLRSSTYFVSRCFQNRINCLCCFFRYFFPVVFHAEPWKQNLFFSCPTRFERKNVEVYNLVLLQIFDGKLTKIECNFCLIWFLKCFSWKLADVSFCQNHLQLSFFLIEGLMTRKFWPNFRPKILAKINWKFNKVILRFSFSPILSTIFSANRIKKSFRRQSGR